MPEVISIEDVGPIESLDLEVIPGVNVLRGRNATGKTQALNAVSRLITGEGPLVARDGMPAGKVEGLGVTITVKRTTRQKGELEAVQIDGKLSIDDLIDPGMSDDEAADSRRIRTIMRINGEEADVSVFKPLFKSEEEMRAIVSSATFKKDGLPEMSTAIKRDLEKAARVQENIVENERGKETSLLESAGEFDFELAKTCPNVLQKDYDQARDFHSKTVGRQEQAAELAESQFQVEEKMQAAISGYTGTPLNDAKHLHSLNLKDVRKAEATVNEARKAFEVAEKALEKAVTIELHSRGVVQRAEEHHKFINECREALAGDVPRSPTDEEVAEAASAAEKAAEKVQTAAVARKCRQQSVDAGVHAIRAKEADKEAKRLRNAAQSVDDVLAKHIDWQAFTIRAGRLCWDEPGRGIVPFSEASFGQKARVALELLLARLKRTEANQPAIIVVGQHIWEGLDDIHRGELAAIAEELDICVFTAQATSEPEVTSDTFSKASNGGSVD